jgi:hypothetical protein
MQNTDETPEQTPAEEVREAIAEHVAFKAPEKTSAWTDEEREKSEAIAAAAAPVGVSERPTNVPRWLQRVRPGTTIRHQGVVMTVVHIGFAGGKFLLLAEPMGLEANTAGQRRARFDELIRAGLGKKAAKRKVRMEFAKAGDDDELDEEAPEVAAEVVDA